MKSFICLLIACSFLYSNISFGADKLYFTQDSFFMGPYNITDGKMITRPADMGYYDLESVFKDNPKALSYFKKYEHHHTKGSWIYWTTFAVGLIVILTPIYSNTGNLPTSINMYLGGLFVWLGGDLWASHEWALGQRQLLNAVNTYNGIDVQDSSLNGVYFQPVATINNQGASLGLQLSF